MTAERREAYRSHITAYQNVTKTSIRMDADLWLEFKKEVHSVNLTTCLVIRALIRNWIEAFRGKFSPTETENAQRLDRIVRDTHNRILEEKGERWIYYKPSMTLYDPKFLRGRLMSKQRETLNLRTKA